MLTTTTQTSFMRAALLLATTLACGSTGDASSTTSSSETGAETTQTTGAAAPTTSGDPSTSTTAVTSSSETSNDPTTGPDDTGTTGTTLTGADTSTGEPVDTGTSADSTGDTTGTTTADDTGSTTGDESTGTTGGMAGLGMLSGECGLIDAMEVESPAPFVFSNAIDFGVIGFDYDLLTPGGQQIFDEGNLNQSSLNSEIVAFEVLARCDMAELLKTEATIVYTDPMGKKTDLLVELAGHKVGVSVVRAVGFPKEDPYTVAQAQAILNKKLGDIKISSANVAPEDKWIKQILSVVAYEPMHVESILTAYEGLDAGLKADTILVVSVTNGDDAFIY